MFYYLAYICQLHYLFLFDQGKSILSLNGTSVVLHFIFVTSVDSADDIIILLCFLNY